MRVLTGAPDSGTVDVSVGETTLNTTPISLAGPKSVRGEPITVGTSRGPRGGTDVHHLDRSVPLGRDAHLPSVPVTVQVVR